MSVSATVGSLLEGVSGGAGDSTAERLFGAGLASLATGGLLPLGAAVVGELLRDRPPVPPYCTYPANPLRLSKPARGDLERFWGPSGFGAAFCLEPHGFAVKSEDSACVDDWWMTGFQPPSAHCKEDPTPVSIAASFPFREFWQLVQSKSLEGTGEPPGSSNDYTQRNEAVVWASWKILDEDEALQRYKLEVLPVLVLMVASTEPDKLAAIESFYGGRVSNGAWRWADETFEGRKIEDWPRWIPLDSEALALRRIYAPLWDHGVSDTGLELLATLDPYTAVAQPGTPVEELRPGKQREYIANALVIGAAKSRGSAQAFEGVRTQLEAIQTKLGWCAPPDCTPGKSPHIGDQETAEAIERLSAAVGELEAAGVSLQKARLHALQSARESRTGWLSSSALHWSAGVLVGAGALGVGVALWLRKRKKKRKRRWL